MYFFCFVFLKNPSSCPQLIHNFHVFFVFQMSLTHCTLSCYSYTQFPMIPPISASPPPPLPPILNYLLYALLPSNKLRSQITLFPLYVNMSHRIIVIKNLLLLKDSVTRFTTFKGTVSRDFDLRFCSHQTIPPRTLIHWLKPFRILLRIREEIRL
jgi:hypothetical protein